MRLVPGFVGAGHNVYIYSGNANKTELLRKQNIIINESLTGFMKVKQIELVEKFEMAHTKCTPAHARTHKRRVFACLQAAPTCFVTVRRW